MESSHPWQLYELFALYNCLQIEMQVMHMAAYPSYQQMTLVLQNHGMP
jgi:hypothetical protein